MQIYIYIYNHIHTNITITKEEYLKYIIIYGNLPTTFENDLMPKLSVMIHSARTRNSTDINYHFDASSKLNMANKSFTADCVKIWNDIPHNIKKQFLLFLVINFFLQLM